MKVYNIVFALLAILTSGCSKSSVATGSDENENFQTADYVVLQKSSNELTSQLLEVKKSEITLNSAGSDFIPAPVSTLTLQKESEFAYYESISPCDGEVVIHDFYTDTSKRINVFPDLSECEVEVTYFEFYGNQLFVSYELLSPVNSSNYFLRVVDMDDETVTPLDITLDKKPLQLSIANDYLFILTLDVGITNENSLSVFQLSNSEIVYEKGLGYSVGQIFTDHNDNIIIAYPELHTVFNSESWNVDYVSYESGKEPEFHNSINSCLDDQGWLFYKMPAEDGNIDKIPAIYDLTSKLTTLFYYENFLTESQLTDEIGVDTTTMVGYDSTNEVMLVGYQKKDNANVGGLLRIQLQPEHKLLDNIDLNGVPMFVFVQD